MVRYYGGKHVGPGRFDLFRQVVHTAVQNMTRKIEEEKRMQDEEELNRDNKPNQ